MLTSYNTNLINLKIRPHQKTFIIIIIIIFATIAVVDVVVLIIIVHMFLKIRLLSSDLQCKV